MRLFWNETEWTKLKYWEKSWPSPYFSPQIPHGLAWDRNRAFAMTATRQTSCGWSFLVLSEWWSQWRKFAWQVMMLTISIFGALGEGHCFVLVCVRHKKESFCLCSCLWILFFFIVAVVENFVMFTRVYNIWICIRCQLFDLLEKRNQ
jgi:hypothetical protein